mmetsp:Transcript_59279/g.133520  ORF Transcript_59279/g.133520 Transcript_59279/m.133520 type:complete len:266 (-) Transcript_59279:98-895(-)
MYSGNSLPPPRGSRGSCSGAVGRLTRSAYTCSLLAASGLPHLRRELLLALLPLFPQVLLDTLVDLEAVDARHVGHRRDLRHQVLIGEEEQVGKGRAEVGAIQALQPRGAGKVDLSAVRAVDLRRVLSQQVGHADWKHRLVQCLALAERAGAVDIGIVLVEHCCHAPACEDEASVDQPVEHLCCSLDERLLLFGKLIILIVKVEDHVQRVLIVRNLRAQPCEVEVILNVVLVDLDKELIALQVTEPFYPRNLLIQLGPGDLRVVLV